MKSHEKRRQGIKYEKLAADYLKDQGYKILEENYFCGHKEIDLICEKDQVIIFTEVKYRKENKNFNPFASINHVKINHIRTCAHRYLAEKKLLNTHYCRFDAIVIINSKGQENGPGITHIPNAFR